MEKNIETRQLATDLSVETRADGQSHITTLKGYAAKFGVLSEDLGGFREKIASGAFARSIEENDVRAFWNHNATELPLGRTKSGTLRLTEDDIGLRFEVDLPQTTPAQDLAVSVDRGDVDGVSFGFRTRKDEWAENGMIRTLLDVDLVEVSPVNWPAYPQTELALRSRQQWLDENTEEKEEKQPKRRTKKLAEILDRMIDIATL